MTTDIKSMTTLELLGKLDREVSEYAANAKARQIMYSTITNRVSSLIDELDIHDINYDRDSMDSLVHNLVRQGHHAASQMDAYNDVLRYLRHTAQDIADADRAE